MPSVFLAVPFHQMDLFLIAQGASGFFWGLFFTNAFSILNDVVPEKEYPVRVATLQTVNFIVLILGPIVCGFLTQQWNWRISLIVLLPLFLLGLYLMAYYMPVSKKQITVSKKYVHGNLLSELQIGTLLKNRGFFIVSLLTFIFTCITCSGKYVPLYAQTELKSSATISAAVLIPCNLIGMIMASLSGVYIKKKGCTKQLMLLMAGAGFTGTLLYVPTLFFTNYAMIILSTAVIGIGLGIYQVAPFAYAQSYIEEHLIAKGMAFIGFIQGAASIVGGLVFAAAIVKGVAFSLATTFIYGIPLLFITILQYEEPIKLHAKQQLHAERSNLL